MNRLNPELQKLFKWARQAPPAPTPDMPFGFSARTVARWREAASGNMFDVWQRAIWGSAWAATAVILLGLMVLTAQRLRTQSPYDFLPAFQAVATDFVP